jgi:DNA-binding transcriptional MerR regulator
MDTLVTTAPSDSPARPASGPAGPGCWRIDALAQRAGVTVDTIRYYQRERLLPAAERNGRTNLYGPEHLDRLERIRELQTRRFSLAAIRALLDDDRGDLLEGIFAGGGGRTYTLEELTERAGIDPALVDALRTSGLLREPAEYGRDSYDSDDLELLRTMAELHRLGIDARALVEIGRIYAEGIDATQRRIVDLFATGGTLVWDADDLAQFQESSAAAAAEFLPLARRIVGYTHHRTIQRLALGAIERGTVAPPPAST